MPKKVTLSPPPNSDFDSESIEWRTWFNAAHTRVGEGPLLIQGYAKASLPNVSLWGSTGSSDPFSSIIFVTDDVGGPTLAFSDGTSWKRVSDNAVIS